MLWYACFGGNSMHNCSTSIYILSPFQLLTCDEIDKNERGWDHSVTENQTYTPEQLTEFDRKLTSLRTADASQRFEFIVSGPCVCGI